MLNFALVGCGRISRKHISVLSSIEQARLVAVCDIIEQRAAAAAGPLGIPYYTDYHEMLKREKIDVVNILTPSGLHGRHVLDIVGSGVQIVVEKPMALTLEDADRMIEACDRAGVKLFVVKQNRYNLAVRELKKALDQGRFGKLVLGTVRVRWCRDQAYYDQDEWRGTWAMDGGVLTNQASHHVDLLEWCMGEVESVFARTATRLVDIEVEDTGAALLKFTSGALGIIEATTATRPRDLEGSISILGERGSVEIAGFAVNEIRTWNFDREDERDEEIRTRCSQSPPDVYGFGHKLFLEDVIRSIDSNTRGLVDGLEGRKSLELINAIYESVETGREVKLKFRPAMCRLGRGPLNQNKATS
ncbi:MAG: Gfo/Idh/MocA family oxidoreductase [Candidatus Glassbacteria bacterium]|nr:Gfo/Idh/MocA family oxidoreductase [Candidatus Glassbacteria bacterium]